MIRAMVTVVLVAWVGPVSAQSTFSNGARTYSDEQLELAKDIGTIYALVEFCKVIPLPSFRRVLKEAGLRDADFYQSFRDCRGCLLGSQRELRSRRVGPGRAC